MKYLAALAAIALPIAAQAVTQAPAEGEIVYECQINESCKSNGCKPVTPVQDVKLIRVEGRSTGTVQADDENHEVHVFRGVGTYEFLQILSGGSVGYTVHNETGKLSVRASGGINRHDRGICNISN